MVRFAQLKKSVPSGTIPNHKMKTTLKVLALSIMAAITTASAFGQARYWTHRDSSGNILGHTLDVAHLSQPTNYTCGGTVQAMLWNWERKKLPLNQSLTPLAPLDVYSRINSTGSASDGIDLNEMKSGLLTMRNWINGHGQAAWQIRRLSRGWRSLVLIRRLNG